MGGSRGRWTKASAYGLAATAAVALSCASFGSADAPTATEGGVTDGGVTDGGVTDGAVGGDGAFCALHPNAVLCDDFDNPARKPWITASIDDAGTLVVQEGGAFSPPNALAVTMSVLSTSGCHYSFEMSGPLNIDAPNGFHLEFKVLPGGSLQKNVTIGPGVTLLGATDKCNYYSSVGPQKAQLYQEHNAPTAATTHEGNFALVPGMWNTVSIDVEGAGPGRVVSLTLNGVVSLGKQPVDLTCQTASHIDHMSVGLFCVERSLGEKAEVTFDDVLLTVP